MNTLLLFIFILSGVYILVTIWEFCTAEKNRRNKEQHYNLYKVYFRKGEDIYTEIIGASSEESVEEIFYQSVEFDTVTLLKIEMFHSRDLTDDD